MCGRFTVKATWAELVALYRLTMDAPPHNLRPRYNVCPTDPVDVVTAEKGNRELVPMRWGPIPRWWSKTLKDAKMATFNARAETVETKPFFSRRVQTHALPYPNVWVLRVARHARWEAALVFHGAR
jgi:putative SOS response-associated peptidase YedK